MLRGFDVSKYNATPSLAGRAFGFVKATEGQWVDPKYRRHAAAISRAGLVQGAYHFGRSPKDTVSLDHQVASFLALADDADLLALDFERPSHVRLVDGTYVTPPAMTTGEAARFISLVHAAGREIGLYASLSGFPRTLGQDWNWIAAYGRLGAPRLGRPRGIPYRFWQYTSTPYDLDVFLGGPLQLHALVAASHR